MNRYQDVKTFRYRCRQDFAFSFCCTGKSHGGCECWGTNMNPSSIVFFAVGTHGLKEKESREPQLSLLKIIFDEAVKIILPKA